MEEYLKVLNSHHEGKQAFYIKKFVDDEMDFVDKLLFNFRQSVAECERKVKKLKEMEKWLMDNLHKLRDASDADVYDALLKLRETIYFLQRMNSFLFRSVNNLEKTWAK